MFNPSLASINGGFIGNIAGMQNNSFKPLAGFDENNLIAQGRVGSIPPTSTTIPYGGWIPFGFGGQQVPYGEQERGLYSSGPGYATPGVVLNGGRRGMNPGKPIPYQGELSRGMDAQDELYYRSPERMLEGGAGNLQLQLRKLGIPGM
jgi:hypothetical protein